MRAEADLKRLLTESSASLKAQEGEVMNLQVAITEAKQQFIKEEEMENAMKCNIQSHEHTFKIDINIQ